MVHRFRRNFDFLKPTAPRIAVAIVLVLASIPITARATDPFTEDFVSSVSNWTNAAGAPATFEISGGPDGSSYASATSSALNYPFNTPVVVFRGQDEFNSSNHAFEGDWLRSGINHFSAYIRHHAPVPLSFFVRIAPPSNFPAVAAERFTLIPPNTWTELSYDISPDKIDVYLFTEGPASLYSTTLSDVGHVQVGYRVPDGLNSDPNAYTFDLDQPSIQRLGVQGDYNGNGTVDAADYVLWRNGGPLQNQVDDPDHVNAQDYIEWRARFGNIAGSGSVLVGNLPVPEPPTITLLLLALSAVIASSPPSGRKI